MIPFKYLLLPLTVLLASCSPNNTILPADLHAGMDTTVSPRNDFYRYANGGWIDSHAIPASREKCSTTSMLSDKVDSLVSEIIQDLITSKQVPGSNAEKIATLYKYGIDTTIRNQEGINPLIPYFNRIDSIDTPKKVSQIFATLSLINLQSPIMMYIESDPTNSSIMTIFISQGNLSMFERNCYLSNNNYYVDMRHKYKRYIANLFLLCGHDSITAQNLCDVTFDVERRLAEIMPDRLDNWSEDIKKISYDDLSRSTKNIDWDTLLKISDCNIPDSVVIDSYDYFIKLNTLLDETPINSWKTYLKFSFLNQSAPLLSTSFANEYFQFYNGINGITNNPDNSETTMYYVNYLFDNAIGQIYIQKHFSEQAKNYITNLTANIKDAFKARICNLDWMSDTTKLLALEKLDYMKVNVGYPDKEIDYSSCIINNSFAESIFNGGTFLSKYWAKYVGKTYDKGYWWMVTPQTVNTYYDRVQNTITICAAILQPPFYYADGDDAVNYGAIGAIIAHEMTHGFDNGGCDFDKYGNIANWWVDYDRNKFDSMSQKLVDRFNSFVVADTIHLDGEYTFNENLADLGGLAIAYTAFTKTEQWKDQDKLIDGLTPDQRFFISYAQTWACNIRHEALVNQVLLKNHAPANFRVEGPLPCIDAFIKAFDIKPGDKYYLPDSLRINIW